MEFATTDTALLRCSTAGVFARIGQHERLAQVIQEGGSVRIPDSRGWLPIHEAAFTNQVACLQLLLDVKDTFDINARAHDGSSALLLAAQHGSEEAAKLLLQHSCDPNLGSLDDMRPLIAAIKSKKESLVHLLLGSGSDPTLSYWNGWTALHEAARQGLHQLVQPLIERGAILDVQDAEGLSPTFVAAQYGHDGVLKEFLNVSSNLTDLINCRANDGGCCVYIASQEGYTRCLRLLLEHGANPDFLTNEGVHPIVPALKFNQLGCVSLLLKYFKPSVLLYSKADPMFVAAEEKHNDCLELLLEYNRLHTAKPSAQLPLDRPTVYYSDFAVPLYLYLQPLLARAKCTPLGVATAKLNVDGASMLLEAGAKTYSIDPAVHSPLLLAILKRRMPELLDCFLRYHKNTLNFFSLNNLTGVPDPLLMALHPIFHAKLKKLLIAGLEPYLENWCYCKQIIPLSGRLCAKPYGGWTAVGPPPGQAYSLLTEISGLLTQPQLRELLLLVTPFSKNSSIPKCCADWQKYLGADWLRQVASKDTPHRLSLLCRLSIRRKLTASSLYCRNWSDKLVIPQHLVDFVNWSELGWMDD